MSIVMDKYDSADEEAHWRPFSLIFGFSQFVGITAIILAAVWMGRYDGGFAWRDRPEQQFHYHPLFMVVGLIFLYGEAILVYRVFRHERKIVVKTAHVIINAVVVTFFVIALKAVFDSHNHRAFPIPNMYSLHSWVGISTVLLYCFQFTFGFLNYYYPTTTLPLRQWYMPIHRYFGIAIFTMACTASLMGITEKAHRHSGCAGSICPPEVIANILGVCIVSYGFAVVYLVVNPKYRRRPLPEEESHQQLVSD